MESTTHDAGWKVGDWKGAHAPLHLTAYLFMWHDEYFASAIGDIEQLPLECTPLGAVHPKEFTR